MNITGLTDKSIENKLFVSDMMMKDRVHGIYLITTSTNYDIHVKPQQYELQELIVTDICALI